MTKPNSTCIATLKSDFDRPSIVQQIEISDDISGLAFVGGDAIGVAGHVRQAGSAPFIQDQANLLKT